MESFYFQWHITDKCNLSCSHCYQNSKTSYRDLPKEDLIKIADIIGNVCAKWGVKAHIALTGGEPFVRKDDLFFLLDYLDALDSVDRIEILSNGLLIDEAILSKLKIIKKVHTIQLSIEAPSALTHDLIRGEGNFEKTIAALRLLKEEAFKVSVMMTLSKVNFDKIRDTYEFLNSLKVDFFAVDRFIPEALDIFKFNTNVLSKEEAYKAYLDFVNIYKNPKFTKALPFRPLFCLFDQDVGAACSAGWSSLTILPDASVVPCRRLPIFLGNILTDGFYKIWFTNDTLWKLREARNLGGKCNECKYIPKCRGCRAMAYALTKDYMAEDSLCWV